MITASLDAGLVGGVEETEGLRSTVEEVCY